MFHICHRLKAAASKKNSTPVAGVFAGVNSLESDSASYKAPSVSIHPSLSGDLASLSAYQAKQVYEELVPQVGTGFSPQVGMSSIAGLSSISFVSECLSNLSAFSHVDIPDYVTKEAEGLIALFFALKDCETIPQFTSIVFLYVRSHCEASMSTTIVRYLTEAFEEPGFTEQSDGDPSWLKLLRNIQENWSLCKNNKAFAQFSKLMGVLVMLGLCDAADLTFDIAGFKVFDDKMLEKHHTAYDLADAILGTVTFFAEGVYLCFKQRSLRPLLVNDRSALEMDEEFGLLTSWFSLVKCGNLERVVGISDQEFDRRVSSLHQKLSNLVPTVKGLDRKIVADKLTKITTIKNELVILKVSSGTRRAPFAIELFGKSSQGKTTFGDQLLDALLTSQSLPIDKEYRAAINPADNFMSNWTSEKLVAIIDDMCHEKSNFVMRPPTRLIIDVCNNQMYYAPKAELEEKGKCFVEPEIALVTTNKKDLDAQSYSNCPYAVQRRMDLVMTVECKPEFQRKDDSGRPCGVDARLVREYYTKDGVYTPPTIDDIWIITIEKAVEPSKLTAVAGYEPITWRGQRMEKVSATTAISCAIDHFNVHRKNQFAIVESMRARTCQMAKCPYVGCCYLKDRCPEHDKGQMEPHLGFATAVAVEKLRRDFNNRTEKSWFSFTSSIEDKITSKLYKEGAKFIDKWDWACLVPEPAFDNKWFQKFVYWSYSEQIKNRGRRTMFSLFCLICYSAFMWSHYTTLLLSLYFIWQWIFIVSSTRRVLLHEMRKRSGTLPHVIKNVRDNYALEICAACAGIGALYFLAKTYKQWKKLSPEQGSLEPKSESDVQARDSELNVWAKVTKKDLPTDPVLKTTTWKQLQNIVDKNLVYGSVKGDKDTESKMCNILFLRSNLVIIPNHYFSDSATLAVTCYKKNAGSIGGKFDTRLCKSSSFQIPETDLRLCYSSTGGSFKDITKYLPVGMPASAPFTMLWRKKDGTMIDAVGRSTPKMTSNSLEKFLGGEYASLSINTFGGLCGATLISQTSSPQILGLHVGGKADTPYGCYCQLTQDQVKEAYLKVRSIEGVIVSGSVDKFVPQLLGKNILTGDPLHPKSPVNYLPEDSQFEYYGSCTGAVTSRSDVRKTPISDIVAEEMGVDNKWGRPKMKPEWFGWQKCMANASHPAKPYPHSLLTTAIKDYKKPLIKLIRTMGWNEMRPLTYQENLCGIPGKKFIDAIDLSTSIGYPLTGAKRNHIIELEPTPDKPNNRKFTQEIEDEIKRCEDLYRQGYRAFTVAKACKKDEVLPTAKEKCRIFYGNPIALTFLIRKYYLPILRFLQMNPLVAECAVGINCHGPEWDEFYNHVTKYGLERLFGGDYGKYDQKLTCQLLFASLRLMIDLAFECCYTEEDLIIMESLTADIVYALIAFNGDLIGIQSGSHISGNSLTVMLNSISGSLNLRAFFYSIYDAHLDFRSAAAMGTYGDDNIGTVHANYPKFNIKDFSSFLKDYGQVYTMPDKESELQEYLPSDSFDFLKRHSVYHPKLGCNLGALAEDSIYKSLHCYMRPKGHPLTPEEACALNIDTALREFFNHGENVYEARRTKLTNVANKAGISHMCTLLSETYNDRLADWESKYRNVTSKEEIQETFCPQSGSEGDVLEEIDAARDEWRRMEAFDSYIDMTLVGYNVPVIRQDFGEIDMLYEKTLDGTTYVLVVEVKSSDRRTYRAKGCMQVLKYVRALSALRKSAHYVGVLVTPHRVVQVCRTHEDQRSWKTFVQTDSLASLAITNDDPLTYL